jgi:HAD superfamily hydrolase (TIGR01509 family)
VRAAWARRADESNVPRAAVGFDFDHTLGLDNGLETTAFYRLAAELGHSVSERDTAWTAFIDDLLAHFRAGSIGQEQAVDRFVKRLGLLPQPAFAQRYRDVCCSLVDYLVTPIDGARELLEALAERAIPTAILTNGWSPLQRLKIAHALGYSGPILISDELGIPKPDPAAFAKLVDVLRVPSERVWYVGDNPKADVAGAQGAGLRGVWFDWENLAYPVDAPPPDARIARLSELLDLLPGPDVRAENVGREFGWAR